MGTFLTNLISIFLIGTLVLPLSGEGQKNAPLSLRGSPKMSSINSVDLEFSKKFDTLGVQLHPGSSYKKNSKENPSTLAHCKATVYKTLNSLPQNHTDLLGHLTLYFTEDGRRGLGAKNSIILRCLNVDDGELAGVFIHEIGHLVDTGLFEGSGDFPESEFDDFGTPVFENDLSVQFYRISWENTKSTFQNSTPLDFVSGYAMNDPFEDFAEAYAYYILHGPEFRLLKAKNRALSKKYDFMKYEVFEGREFGLGFSPITQVRSYYRNYDVTVLDYDTQSFFAGKF